MNPDAFAMPPLLQPSGFGGSNPSELAAIARNAVERLVSGPDVRGVVIATSHDAREWGRVVAGFGETTIRLGRFVDMLGPGLQEIDVHLVQYRERLLCYDGLGPDPTSSAEPANMILRVGVALTKGGAGCKSIVRSVEVACRHYFGFTPNRKTPKRRGQGGHAFG